MESYRHRRRKRPRSRRPDDGVDAFAGERRIDRLRLTRERVLHPYAGTGVLFVFDFGFGECGAIDDAPIDGTKSLVDESVFPEVKEDARDHRLVLRLPRRVRMLEIAADA